MLSFLKKIFSDPTADWPRSVTDSVLGELRLSDDAEWWEGSTTIGSKTVGFKIGGEGKPDTKSIAHAHDIVRSLPVFEQSVAAFLADEARTVKHLTQYADEIRQLTIENVCLVSPDRPNDGMIYFKAQMSSEYGDAIMLHGNHEDLDLTVERSNHTLQRTRPMRHDCNRVPSWAGSLSLGR